jgi:DNA-binding Lrp family transcriptional regulator
MKKDGTCLGVVLAEYLGIAERTVRDRVNKYTDEFVIIKGIISQKK